jgi:hypothetical protein
MGDMHGVERNGSLIFWFLFRQKNWIKEPDQAAGFRLFSSRYAPALMTVMITGTPAARRYQYFN